MADSVRIIHFNALPEKARERLVSCFKGEGAPEPIVSLQTATGGQMLWFACVALGALVASVVMAFIGFGVYDEVEVFQDFFWLLGYLAVAFIGFYGVFALLRVWRTRRAFPYPPGLYLFPMDVIDARSDQLKILSMASMTDFRGVHHHTNGVYGHTLLHFTFEGNVRHTFMVRGKDKANRLLEDLAGRQRLVQSALQEQKFELLAAMDPLVEARVNGAWDRLGPKAPPKHEIVGGTLAGSVPVVLRYASVPALIFAMMAAPALWGARNAASDELAFRGARAVHSEAAYQDYLRWSAGWLHADEVRAKHMPNAAYGEAKARKSVTAMRDFLKRYPKAGYKKKARKQIARLYKAALKDFKKQSAKDNKALLPFMKDLLAYLEEHGTPDVRVRFRSPDEGALSEIDGALTGKGDIAPVAPYFTLKRNMQRESIIAGSLQRGFAAVFPEDILSLDQGKRLPKKRSKKVKNPTIEVVYTITPSGQIYESKQSKRAFVGIKVDFDVSMRVPGRKKALDFDLSVEPPDRFRVSYSTMNTFGTGDGPSDGKVYDVMAALAFEKLSTHMRTVFFDEDSKAFKDSVILGGDEQK